MSYQSDLKWGSFKSISAIKKVSKMLIVISSLRRRLLSSDLQVKKSEGHSYNPLLHSLYLLRIFAQECIVEEFPTFYITGIY